MAPGFASEAEALAAAEAAYASYLAMSDLIASEGGANPERIAPFVTEEWLVKELESFGSVQASGNKLMGSTSFAQMTIQTMTQEDLSVYACLDVSDSRVVNAAGIDVTPVDRIQVINMQIDFRVLGSGSLVLARGESWPAGSFC